MEPTSFEAALYIQIGRLIKRQRTLNKLTQEQVASAIGLTRTSIVNIERGRHRLPLHVLFGIARAVHAEPRDLIPTIEQIDSDVSGQSFLDEVINRKDLNSRAVASLNNFIVQHKKTK